LAEYRAEGDRHGEGLALLLTGMLERSADPLDRAQAILQAEGDYLATATAVWFRARLDREEGRPAAAANRLESELAWLCGQESAPFDLEQLLRFAKIFGGRNE